MKENDEDNKTGEDEDDWEAAADKDEDDWESSVSDRKSVV